MSRREFVEGVCLCALTATTQGCLSPGGTSSVSAARQPRGLVKAALVHLGSNMWCDVYTDAKPPAGEPEAWDFKDRVDFLRTEDEVWREYAKAMCENGFNAIVIDLGEALRYPSHPELAVRGSWSVEKLKDELARLREMGLEPIPKLNFSTTHNAWMKDWRYRVCTPEYDDFCAELVDDVVSVFDGPRLFHIGHDEETVNHQDRWGHYQYVTVRRGELFWKGFRANYDAVKAAGCRPWCFSDQIWYDRQRFVDNMPRDVIQCPWNCVAKEGHPEYTESIDDMVRLGFDFIPDCSTYQVARSGINQKEMPFALSYYCGHIPESRRLGFLVCPWVTTTSGAPREKFVESMRFANECFVRQGV